MTLREGMQLPTCTWAYWKRSPAAARRSIWGVVSGSLQPNAPTESQLMSSTVMTSRLRGSAAETEAAADANTAAATIKVERYMAKSGNQGHKATGAAQLT